MGELSASSLAILTLTSLKLGIPLAGAIAGTVLAPLMTAGMRRIVARQSRATIPAIVLGVLWAGLVASTTGVIWAAWVVLTDPKAPPGVFAAVGMMGFMGTAVPALTAPLIVIGGVAVGLADLWLARREAHVTRSAAP